MTRILYLSCHEILEHDELKLFQELGYGLFSPGAYVEPQNRGDGDLRPGIPGLVYNPDVVAQYHRIGAQFPGQDGKRHLTKEFIDNFDVIIVMHIPEWIELNWEAMKHKRVIWRTIGQSVASVEKRMAPYKAQGLQVVRYSPREVRIPHFAGMDALIRFYKDPAIYQGWTGGVPQVITFAQSMQQRGTHCNYALFEQVTRPFQRKLFGPENHQPGFGMGKISWAEQIRELQRSRAYLYTGTHPASYTLNFIESWMAGIPVVAIGPKYGNADVWRNHDLYEIQDLIQNGVNGFISDEPAILTSYVQKLLTDEALARRISAAGRAEAIRHFNKDMIKASWKAFLER
jgi:glycosyltransferase involved in cell wall biosynthesis